MEFTGEIVSHLGMAELANKVVLVTGAGKRLGREIALACARAGWRVAVHYRSSEENAIETVALCAYPMPANMLFCLKMP